MSTLEQNPIHICDYPGCGKSFVQPSSLYRHQRDKHRAPYKQLNRNPAYFVAQGLDTLVQNNMKDQMATKPATVPHEAVIIEEGTSNDSQPETAQNTAQWSGVVETMEIVGSDLKHQTSQEGGESDAEREDSAGTDGGESQWCSALKSGLCASF